MNLRLQKTILGCGNFGGIGSSPLLFGKGEAKEEAFFLLDHARELGIHKFDTANTYGGGLSEEYLGEWISKQDLTYRKTIQIHTKVGNPHGNVFDKGHLTAQELDFHLNKSLTRLGAKSIDLYYIHEPDELSDLRETVEKLIEFIHLGKIKKFGLSNVNLEYVERFMTLLSKENLQHFFGVQNEFNFLCQNDLEILTPYLKKNGLNYTAFGPLAGGLLSGKYEDYEHFPVGSRLSLIDGPYKKFLTEIGFKKITYLKKLASMQRRELAEVAFDFILEREEVDYVIIGPRKKEHYESLGFKFS